MPRGGGERLSAKWKLDSKHYMFFTNKSQEVRKQDVCLQEDVTVAWQWSMWALLLRNRDFKKGNKGLFIIKMMGGFAVFFFSPLHIWKGEGSWEEDTATPDLHCVGLWLAARSLRDALTSSPQLSGEKIPQNSFEIETGTSLTSHHHGKETGTEKDKLISN